MPTQHIRLRRLRVARSVTFLLLGTTITHASQPSPLETAATANNSFAFDLYAKVSAGNGNICISPYSISSAMDMTAAGAVGNTQQQMLNALHWTGSPLDLPAAAAKLRDSLMPSTDADNTPTRFTVANALFGQNGFAYHQDFLNRLNGQYTAPMITTDFAKEPAQACEQINQWAAEKTQNKIKNAISPAAISPQTRLVLINAVYFKANWNNPFQKAATQGQPFFTSSNESTTLPLMQQTDSFAYTEDDALQAAELPYHGNYSMIILLPKKRDGLPDLEKSITAQTLDRWIGNLQFQQLQLFLPRFKIEGDYQLSQPLARLGMTDAFDPHTADFSAISSRQKLWIDQVIHKTFIAVDEEGTEAAAITGVTMRTAAAMHRAPPTIFRADHPFLYILRQRSTGTILFLGRMAS